MLLCLRKLSLPEQNATKPTWLEQPRFLSQFEGWKSVTVKAPGNSVPGETPCLACRRALLAVCSQGGRREKVSVLSLFLQSHGPTRSGPHPFIPFGRNCLLKTPPPCTVTQRVRLQHMDLGETLQSTAAANVSQMWVALEPLGECVA